VRSLSYIALWEATRKGEREVEVAVGQVEVEGGGQVRRGSCCCVVVLSSPGPPLYIGVEGCTLDPSPSHKDGVQEGEEGGGGWGGASQAGPKNPNPGRLSSFP
jgi:hypothetical protein